MKLYNRRIRVTINTIQIESLAVKFQVTKTLKPEPNQAEITILNLSPAHRSSIEQAKTAMVQLEAGYEDGMSTLFMGDLRTAVSTVNGADIETKLSSGDGEKAVKTARVQVSMKKGICTPAKVLEAVAKALGVGQGNLKQAMATLASAGIQNHFSEGVVLTGSAFREMTHVCESLGLTWSIQNGALQILARKTALAGTALEVSEKTGLIGSPTVDNKGVMSAKILMIPDVTPGRKIVLKAARLQGQYRLESCKYSGDTHGGDWYIDLEGKRY